MITNKGELLRRYCVFMIGISLGALGVTLYAKAALGVNSVACASYVFSYYFPITMGMMSIILYGLMMLGQFFLYPKEQRRTAIVNMILQVPAIIVFGLLVDLATYLTSDFIPEQIGYWCCLLCCVISSIIIALCITFQTKANVVMLPSDGLVVMYAKHKHYSLGKVKLVFDMSFVIVAVVVSLWQSSFSEITGVREGSIIGSLLVGPIVQFLLSYFNFLDPFFTKTSKVKS